jgi:hypothetical protein
MDLGKFGIQDNLQTESVKLLSFFNLLIHPIKRHNGRKMDTPDGPPPRRPFYNFYPI